MGYWCTALEQRILAVVVYLDISKAFDSVLHTCLLIKLQAYGICGDLYNWFCDYLTERKNKLYYMLNQLVGLQ